MVDSLDQRHGVIMGALLADAASLGLHWLYDPVRISEVVSAHSDAAFVPVDKRNYDGVAGYFAHAKRRDGTLSQYGECLRLAVEVMNESGGRFDVQLYQQRFVDWFGMGGRYVGYIDRPTRGAVENIIAEKVDPSGIDDDQLPAITRVPAIVAGGNQDRLKDVVEISNVGEAALGFADVFARLLGKVLAGGEVKGALAQTATETTDDDIRKLLIDALETDVSDSVAYGEITQRACHLPQGMPLAFHILNNASDYRDAVTRNILAGGDSCGRAMIVGSVAGAVVGSSGLPGDWLLKMRDGRDLWSKSKAFLEFG